MGGKPARHRASGEGYCWRAKPTSSDGPTVAPQRAEAAWPCTRDSIFGSGFGQEGLNPRGKGDEILVDHAASSNHVTDVHQRDCNPQLEHVLIVLSGVDASLAFFVRNEDVGLGQSELADMSLRKARDQVEKRGFVVGRDEEEGGEELVRALQSQVVDKFRPRVTPVELRQVLEPGSGAAAALGPPDSPALEYVVRSAATVSPNRWMQCHLAHLINLKAPMRSECWQQAEVYRVTTSARTGEDNAPSWISKDIDSTSSQPQGGLIVRKGYCFVG